MRTSKDGIRNPSPGLCVRLVNDSHMTLEWVLNNRNPQTWDDLDDELMECLEILRGVRDRLLVQQAEERHAYA